MPFGYFRLHHFSRILGTHAAPRTLDYLLRTGRYADLAFERRHHEAFRLPDWAEGEVRTFFRASEQYERGGGHWAHGMQCALPRELAQRDYVPLARQFVEQACGTHVGCWALHNERARDGGANWHIHVLVSGRICDAWERPPQQFFRRYNAAEPWKGGARKDPRFIVRSAAYQLRKTWVELINTALAGAGFDIELSIGWTRAQQIREVAQKIDGLEQDRLENQLDIVRLQRQQKREITIGSPQRQRVLGLGLD